MKRLGSDLEDDVIQQGIQSLEVAGYTPGDAKQALE
jgi:hypothetical protein